TWRMSTPLSTFRPTPFFFFFNDTVSPAIYTLSLHDALPISSAPGSSATMFRSNSSVRTRSDACSARPRSGTCWRNLSTPRNPYRSEEHTSELQSQSNLVCRLLLEKKKLHNIYLNLRESVVPL